MEEGDSLPLEVEQRVCLLKNKPFDPKGSRIIRTKPPFFEELLLVNFGGIIRRSVSSISENPPSEGGGFLSGGSNFGEGVLVVYSILFIYSTCIP